MKVCTYGMSLRREQRIATSVLNWFLDKVPETIDNNYVSTIRTVHKLKCLPVPESSPIHFRLTSEGFKKKCKKPVQQADPISHDILDKVFPHVKFDQELEAGTWVAVLVGFNLMLHVSNLGLVTRADFDPYKQFTRADFQIYEGHPALSIHWLKTVQHRNKTRWVPLIPASNTMLYLVRWLRKMFKIIPAMQEITDFH